MLYIGMIIAISAVVICAIVYKHQMDKCQQNNEELHRLNNRLHQENAQLKKDKVQLNEQLDNAITRNTDEMEAQANKYQMLIKSIDAAEEQLTALNNQVAERTKGLGDAAANFEAMHDKVVETAEYQKQLEKSVKQYQDELDVIIKELSDAKETKRSMLLNDSQNKENGFDFSISDKEQRLITIMHEISNMYPELSSDLFTIEWKKVWLPQLQYIVNMNGLAVRGIYRLVLKSDEKICYVGQAVNIKERGYEHVKKMIGVTPTGNERLYKYRPDDFYGTVLEIGTNDLNAAEKYGIDYYCCKEIGLNKK